MSSTITRGSRPYQNKDMTKFTAFASFAIMDSSCFAFPLQTNDRFDVMRRDPVTKLATRIDKYPHWGNDMEIYKCKDSCSIMLFIGIYMQFVMEKSFSICVTKKLFHD